MKRKFPTVELPAGTFEMRSSGVWTQISGTSIVQLIEEAFARNASIADAEKSK